MPKLNLLAATLFSLTAFFAGSAAAQSPATATNTYAGSEPLGVALEGWPYPYPLQTFQFELEGQSVRMMYMDVHPANPNGKTVLLFHGKNFGADYWANTLRALDALKVQHVAVIANSMGGMLGVHFARRYPERVTHLVLENPLGLEDYRASIPPQATDNLVKLEMAQTSETYRRFLMSYFPNWKPEFERFVEIFARVQKSAEYPRFAKVSALTYQMIYDGPITAELSKLSVPTLLAIGQSDHTVFGRRFAPPEAVKSLGNFVQLGKLAQAHIPGARLLEFEGVGHVPHMEVPERCHSAVLEFLAAR